MLSIEEIKLLIEKLRKVKKADLQALIDSNLKILEDLAVAVDANNSQQIDRLDKTTRWFERDLQEKQKNSNVSDLLFRMIQTKIFQFTKTSDYCSLEIGPGNGMFSKEFRSWRKNFFLDVLQSIERKIRRRFNPGGQKHLTFYTTRDHECSNIPQGSCSFIFRWDTLVFFTQNHIQHYLNSIKRILVPGGYVFLQYADCHYDYDLHQAKRGYWNYNTKSAMEKMIKEEGYEVIEMRQFCTGANYVIFKKPGKNNPFTYKVSEITLD